MARYEATIESPRTPEDAWAYMADFTNAVRWDPATVEARRLDDGPIGVGARFHLVVRFLGRHVPLDYEIVDAAPPGRIVLVAQAGRTRSRDEITVEATGGGSRLTYAADLRVEGLLGRILDPVLALVFRRMGGEAAAGLARELGS